MQNGIKCEDCIHSRKTFHEDTRQYGKEYSEGLEPELLKLFVLYLLNTLCPGNM